MGALAHDLAPNESTLPNTSLPETRRAFFKDVCSDVWHDAHYVGRSRAYDEPNHSRSFELAGRCDRANRKRRRWASRLRE
jgi:hypothetical protein